MVVSTSILRASVRPVETWLDHKLVMIRMLHLRRYLKALLVARQAGPLLLSNARPDRMRLLHPARQLPILLLLRRWQGPLKSQIGFFL